jgi:hypothetical protein
MLGAEIFNGTTPNIDAEEIKKIMAYEMEHLGGGVIRFPNAVQIDQSVVLPWIDKNAQSAHEQRWKYMEDELGEVFAVNEDGNKFALAQVEETPVRVLESVKTTTEPEMVEMFNYWEDMIYKCLLRYIDEFPMVLGTIWWRARGHVLRYDEGDYLGTHNDNDSNFKSTGGQRYIPRGQLQMRQVVACLIYVNDCVDTEEELDGSNYIGGELFFEYLGIESKPKKGDIIIFPTNFMATHGVKPVIKGKRYCYLEFLCQGSTHEEVLVNIAEPNECDGWCRPHWLDNLYDDYQRYCSHSEFGRTDIHAKTNPVYQNRTLEGEAGLRKHYEAYGVVEDNLMRGKIKID